MDLLHGFNAWREKVTEVAQTTDLSLEMKIIFVSCQCVQVKHVVFRSSVFVNAMCQSLTLISHVCYYVQTCCRLMVRDGHHCWNHECL